MTTGQRALAKAMGVGLKTANKYVRDPRWTLGKGPWSKTKIAQAKAWRRTHYPTEAEQNEPASVAKPRRAAAIGNLPLDPVGRAKYALLVKRIAKIEFENQTAAGGYLKTEDVERGRLERIQSVRAELTNIRLLAIKLQGKDVRECEQVLEEWARAVCRKFEAGE